MPVLLSPLLFQPLSSSQQWFLSPVLKLNVFLTQSYVKYQLNQAYRYILFDLQNIYWKHQKSKFSTSWKKKKNSKDKHLGPLIPEWQHCSISSFFCSSGAEVSTSPWPVWPLLLFSLYLYPRSCSQTFLLCLLNVTFFRPFLWRFWFRGMLWIELCP